MNIGIVYFGQMLIALEFTCTVRMLISTHDVHDLCNFLDLITNLILIFFIVQPFLWLL